jgi:hypothetical protein
LEKRWLCSAKVSSVWVHRTVRWCTGQCPVRQAGSGELAALGKELTAYDYNSPDCPVCTGLSGEPTVGRANGRPGQRSAARSARDTWPSQRSGGCTGLSGEPTVDRSNGRLRDLRETRGRANGREGAPDCSVCTGQCPVRQRLQGYQRSASPNKEGNPHRTVSGGAPDCPVHQAAEGKNYLPGMHSTAPSYLGAIKGTPRRMEEYTKHSLSIPKH